MMLEQAVYEGLIVLVIFVAFLCRAFLRWPQ